MGKFTPTDEQWEKMKRHIKSDTYKKEDFFVFETLAVGDKIVPNRYMKLTPQLLSVMRDDAEKGVSLMLNHNWGQMGVQSIPIGKVFDGRIANSSQDGETTALYTTQYILKDDSKVDGYSKNDIIKLIESGILSDTSVGWGTTRDAYKCSICGNSIYDWKKCDHIPGRKYIIDEESNEVKQCIIEANPPAEKHVGNNVLMENSIVFDGAYPNAVIQSAIGDGIDTPKGKFKMLEGKEKLSENDVIFGYSTAGSVNLLYKQSTEKGGVEDMEDNKEVTELENQNAETVNENETTQNNETENEVTEVETEAQVENETEVETQETVETETDSTEGVATGEQLYTSKDILEKFGNICDSVEQLVELAREGLEIRNEVISQALASGVHSMGNAFNKEVFAKTFSNMKIKDIKEMAEVWEKQANDMFKKEKVSKQEFANGEESSLKIGLSQFKTGNY